MIAFLPPQEAQTVAVDAAKQVGTPFMSMAEPKIREAIARLYSQGYVVTMLSEGPTVAQIVQKLSTGQRAVING